MSIRTGRIFCALKRIWFEINKYAELTVQFFFWHRGIIYPDDRDLYNLADALEKLTTDTFKMDLRNDWSDII